MGYGDLHFFDIIVFAGIAIFLIYRLKNVLGKRGGFEKKETISTPTENSEQNISKKSPALKDNESKLSKVYEAMPDFDHKNFLEGAKFAFETIINAFNGSDKKTLKNLLSEEVLVLFEKSIEKGENSPGYQFYSLTVDGVEDVVVSKDDVNITLKITSEQFKDGDENTVTKKEDHWTFQKKINSKSTIWLLAST